MFLGCAWFLLIPSTRFFPPFSISMCFNSCVWIPKYWRWLFSSQKDLTEEQRKRASEYNFDHPSMCTSHSSSFWIYNELEIHYKLWFTLSLFLSFCSSFTRCLWFWCTYSCIEATETWFVCGDSNLRLQNPRKVPCYFFFIELWHLFSSFWIFDNELRMMFDSDPKKQKPNMVLMWLLLREFWFSIPKNSAISSISKFLLKKNRTFV